LFTGQIAAQDIYEAVTEAEKRIERFVLQTSMQPCRILSELTGAKVYLKNEHTQYTGSFKVRGALSSIIKLKETVAQPKVIAASTGNHGLGVAYASHQFAIPVSTVKSVTFYSFCCQLVVILKVVF
jgi:threonine dehydratase